MDEVYKFRRNCYNLSDSRDAYVKEWVNNQTTEKIIRAGPYPWIPFAFFTRWNDTYYEWCGPLMLIAQYFAKFTNTRLNFFQCKLFPS